MRGETSLAYSALVTAPTSAHDLLRHALATLAYRAGKALRDAPAGFETFSIAPGSRTPGQILAHMGDLFDWALHLARGAQVWHDATQLPWDQEVARFFTALEAFDRHLASGAPLPEGFTEDKLFQGPVADALTHTGQIGMLRRLAGSPVRGESYFRSDIEIGRVGPDQAAPVREFD
jgi:hypothetical protein